jgi:hypothetical protein
MPDEFCGSRDARDRGGAPRGASPVLLRREAERCRRLANMIGDRRTTDLLRAMADDYEARAVATD